MHFLLLGTNASPPRWTTYETKCKRASAARLLKPDECLRAGRKFIGALELLRAYKYRINIFDYAVTHRFTIGRRGSLSRSMNFIPNKKQPRDPARAGTID